MLCAWSTWLVQRRLDLEQLPLPLTSRVVHQFMECAVNSKAYWRCFKSALRERVFFSNAHRYCFIAQPYLNWKKRQTSPCHIEASGAKKLHRVQNLWFDLVLGQARREGPAGRAGLHNPGGAKNTTAHACAGYLSGPLSTLLLRLLHTWGHLGERLGRELKPSSPQLQKVDASSFTCCASAVRSPGFWQQPAPKCTFGFPFSPKNVNEMNVEFDLCPACLLTSMFPGRTAGEVIATLIAWQR